MIGDRLVTAMTNTDNPTSVDGTYAVAMATTKHLNNLAELLRKDGATRLVGRPVETTSGHLVRLEESLEDLATRARALATIEAAAVEAEALGRDPDEVVIYDEYFGLSRAASLSKAEELATSLPTMLSVVVGALRGPARPDVTADMLAFFAHRIEEAFSDPFRRTNAAQFGGENLHAKPVAVRNGPREQWGVGHGSYALANRCSAMHLEEASTAYAAGDIHRTIATLIKAGCDVAAITASMNYAGSMTSLQYRTEVRPSMAYPECGVELTGGMNLDHATYRAAMEHFLALCGEDYVTLARRDEVLALVRDGLLTADLYDLECHVELTYRLVGAAPALDERDDGSAVQALRGMYARRLQRYSPMMRLGRRTDIANQADDDNKAGVGNSTEKHDNQGGGAAA